MNFNSIPKFCISLKDSPRRRVVKQEFERFNIENVAFFDAIDKNDLVVPELSPKLKCDEYIAPGILACMSSHVAIIKKAKELNMPAICIFEDDVIFCDDFRERIAYIEQCNIDFDFFSLGGHFQKPDRKMIPNDNDANLVSGHIYKTIHHGGTYAYIITERVYDFVIRNCSYHFGMDEFYNDFVYPRFNCFAFVPFPCGCRHGISEISGSAFFCENVELFYQQDSIPNLVPTTITPRIVNVERVVSKRKTNAIDLMDCTFITAVKIESKDREFNFLRVIQFICNNFATNIIIKESDKNSRVVELLPLIDRKECIIQFDFERNESPIFHRTRLLNEALMQVKTEVTVNYDIDVFMEVNAYIIARDKVIKEGFDLVYPFAKGDAIQKQVTVPEHIKNNYSGENLFNPDWQKPWQSYCGHVQFFKTDSYISGGMENEEMVSYGPEDRERCERFQRLGYKVMWADACVYHIEHSRDENSSTLNPHFANNDALMTRLRNMSNPEMIEYYKNVSYIKKYLKK